MVVELVDAVAVDGEEAVVEAHRRVAQVGRAVGRHARHGRPPVARVEAHVETEDADGVGLQPHLVLLHKKEEDNFDNEFPNFCSLDCCHKKQRSRVR